MNILVVNDDGINAKGLSELVKALSEKGSVYVCAPDSERSGSSRSITLGETIKIEQFPTELIPILVHNRKIGIDILFKCL